MPETKLSPWSPIQERLATPLIHAMTALNVLAYKLTGGWLGGTLRGGFFEVDAAAGRRSASSRRPASGRASRGPSRSST